MEWEERITEVYELIKNSKQVIVLTGAGISVPSGIPDFRGPNGIYKKFSPEIFDVSFLYNYPEKFYEFAKKHLFSMLDAQPNIAHKLLAKMEELGLIKAIITQNIDNLHQKAGSKNVIELHGNISRFYCDNCGEMYSVEDVFLMVQNNPIPICRYCGGFIRPDVVFFGESLPEDALDEAIYLATTSDLILVIGSSLVVYPAASIPYITFKNGGKVVIINKGETGMDDIAYIKIDNDIIDFSESLFKIISEN